MVFVLRGGGSVRLKPSDVLERARAKNLHLPDSPVGAMYGAFHIWGLFIISSGPCEAGDATGGWEHVSVSLPKRTPTWAEMCFVKDLFFEEGETVIQLHPPKSQHINIHEFCLHLWRNANGEQQLPPFECV